MDQKLRQLEKQAETGDSLSFQKFVLEECRAGKHFFELEKIEYPAILEHDLQKRYKHLFLNNTTPIPENVGEVSFSICDTYRKQCIWCKEQKTFVEWVIEGYWRLPEDVENAHKHRTIIKEGTIVV